ncbi:unnamed protein product, partial [Rotaria sp. Silwood1]
CNELIDEVLSLTDTLKCTEMSDCTEHTLPERSNNPKTQETKQTCKVLLGFIQETIDDQAQSILCDTVDEVLIVLKNDKLRDKDHKNEIETFLIRKIPEQRFVFLVNLGKKLLIDQQMIKLKKKVKS